jgi:diacylglycerol kinase (CTP)
LLINLDSINIQSSKPKTRPKRSPSPPKRKRNSSQSLSPSQGYGNQDQLHHQHHPPPQQQQGLEHNGQTTRHSHRKHSHGDTDNHFLDPGKRQHNHPAHGSSHYDAPDTFTISSSSEPVATVRSSRRDKHLHSSIPNTFWPSGFNSLRRIVVGAVRCSALPPFCLTMSFRSKVPETPRVISPSPTPSERDASDYMGPVTRSAARRRTPTPQPLHEELDEDIPEPPEFRRARTRSRSPIDTNAVTRLTRRTSTAAKAGKMSKDTIPEEQALDGALNGTGNGNGKASTSNGHLAPPQPSAPTGWSWRDFSRSPSPLGLIPIHRHWRTFVHKHEVPRKVLHVSIGFFVIWLYVTGTQTTSVTPWLMSALIPITTVDWLRHRYASVNRFYVKALGALMRESEYSGWNGVIFYLLGAWIVLFNFPKDVGIMSVLLLSWCDTAASTFGRLWGRYTPRLRKGKSLAGSTAAFLVGVGTSYFFYGWLVPTIGPFPGDENFMFNGILSLPKTICEAVGVSQEQTTISGAVALGVMGIWSGFVASASEVVDIFGWDDNLTIPVLSGIGIWGFLKIFS